MRQSLVRFAFITLIAVAFLTVFSPTTSPIAPRYGDDAALFRVIGTALADGQRLYLDVWDHKGPIFFFYQWLGQVIYPGRLGIFILQSILLAAALFCFDSIAQRFGGIYLRLATGIAILAYLSCVIDGGNLTEEFSLFFLALPLALLTRGWGNGSNPAHSHIPHQRDFFIAGIAFGIVVFVRLNNALPIFAVFLAYFLIALLRKEKFWRPLCASLLGFSAVVIAVFGFFWASNSVQEMLDASFFFNFRYASEGDTASEYFALLNTHYFYLASIAVASCLTGGIVNAIRTRDNRYAILSMLTSICTAVAVLASTNGYPHYLQTAIPSFALGVILLIGSVQKEGQLVALVCIALVSSNIIWTSMLTTRSMTVNEQHLDYYSETREILSHVPELEQSHIFPWSVSSKYYLVSGELPVYRYFTLQEWWGKADPSIIDETLDHLQSSSPKWILTQNGGAENVKIAEFLTTHYKINNENSLFRLYEQN